VRHRHCKYRFIVIARRRQYATPPNTWFRRPSGAARGGRGVRPPPRNWVHKEIAGCAVELNTQNCAWFGSQIYLITAMNFREAMPPEPPTRGSAPGPRWGYLRSPDPLCPAPPNPGYATASAPNSISIGSSVFARFTVVPNTTQRLWH